VGVIRQESCNRKVTGKGTYAHNRKVDPRYRESTVKKNVISPFRTLESSRIGIQNGNAKKKKSCDQGNREDGARFSLYFRSPTPAWRKSQQKNGGGKRGEVSGPPQRLQSSSRLRLRVYFLPYGAAATASLKFCYYTALPGEIFSMKCGMAVCVCASRGCKRGGSPTGTFRGSLNPTVERHWKKIYGGKLSPQSWGARFKGVRC